MNMEHFFYLLSSCQRSLGAQKLHVKIMSSSPHASSLTANAASSIAPWVLQTSRRTGRNYFFNSATGVSLWASDDSGTLPAGWGARVSAPDAAPVYVQLVSGAEQMERPVAVATVAVSADAPLAAARRAAVAAAAAGNAAAFRSACECVCEELISAAARLRAVGAKDAAEETLFCRFPPQLPGTYRFMAEEVADERGLRSATGVPADAPPGADRCLTLYTDSYPPPEVRVAAAEEAALQAEAERRRADEAAAVRAAAAAAATAAGDSRRTVSGKRPGSRHLAPLAALTHEAVKVEAMFPRADKRSISEVQNDLKRNAEKRMRGNDEP